MCRYRSPTINVIHTAKLKLTGQAKEYLHDFTRNMKLYHLALHVAVKQV